MNDRKMPLFRCFRLCVLSLKNKTGCNYVLICYKRYLQNGKKRGIMNVIKRGIIIPVNTEDACRQGVINEA